MLIGELLVYRYRLITKEQRDTALAQQQAATAHQPLGEILLGQGLVTKADLEEVLAYQQEQRNPWDTAR